MSMFVDLELDQRVEGEEEEVPTTLCEKLYGVCCWTMMILGNLRIP